MPTQKEVRSDISLLLTKSTQSKNFRVEPNHLNYKINEKRARGIREEAHRNEEYISPSWIQDMGKLPITLANSANDPTVPQQCKEIGKVIIPQVIDLPEDRGVYRISSSSKQDVFFPIEPNRFFDIVPGSVYAKFKYYTRMGTALYLRNAPMEINAELILDNPMEGFVINNTNIQSGYLTIGDVFKVTNGNITHNAVTYYAGQTFTAVNANFTGTGTVQYNLQKRRMNENDPFPLSFTLTDYIIMKILTQDFKIEESQIADLSNDAKDQLVLFNQQQQRTS